MALVEGVNKLISFDARKRFGFSNLYGTSHFGYSLYGDQNSEAGIYKRQKLAKGWGLSKMVFYWPSNPRTLAQQVRRIKFLDGRLNWLALTDGVRTSYNNKAIRFRMTGYNLFLSQYLKKLEGLYGASLFGASQYGN